MAQAYQPLDPPALETTARRGSRRLEVGEGWLMLLLHAVVVVVTALAVSDVEGNQQTSLLVPLALGGLMVGFALARTRALDTFAHFFAFLSGIAVSLVAGAVAAQGVTGVWESRGRAVVDLADRVVSAYLMDAEGTLESYELATVIGLTLWLVGYSSSWMLHRRHWLAPALMLPAVITIVGLRFDDTAPVAPLIAFGAAAMVMTARHHAFMRAREWDRHRVPAPSGISTRFVAGGATLTGIALLAGLSLSLEAPQHVKDDVFDRAQQAWEDAGEVLQRFGANEGGEGQINGSYSTFSDSFSIGGEFNPSPAPVAALTALEPVYLALRRYDLYEDSSWSSNVDATFQLEEDSADVPATSVTFAPNQPWALSSDTSQARENRAAVVTVFRPKDGLLFTTDTFVSASERSVAVIGWKRLPVRSVNVATLDPATLPIDLQGLARSLSRAQFESAGEGVEPIIIDQELAGQISAERRRLLSYPVYTELSVGPNGELILTFEGRIPNYDDVEALFSNDGGSSGDRYRIIGSESIADEAMLRAAGTGYPSWITERYLQLPDTVTDRTTALADQIVTAAGADNPFDAAWAIQSYLQMNFAYQLNSSPPPGDQDIVDYFLFDSQVGRCEHYATAMIVMLRSEGIPARLVSGYRATDERDSAGDFLYREELIHTWVEAFFPGYGWIPFEPTQGQRPFDYDGTVDPPSDLPEQDPAIAVEPTPTPEPVATAEPSPVVMAPLSPTTDDDGSRDNGVAGRAGLAGGVLLALLVIGAGAAVIAWGFSLRGFSPAAALYQRTIRIGRLWGIEPKSTMTPAEYADEWSRTVPRAGTAVRYVTDLYANERYGGVELTPEADRDVRDAWREVRSAVKRWRPWGRARRS